MPTLGQTLKAEREKRGWSIADVAAKTRIQAQYFEAIERDDTAALPGGFFYRSFVRQYARLLELPESVFEGALEQHLLDEQTALAAQPTSLHERPLNVPPLPTGGASAALETRKWLLRLGGLALVVVLCSFLYSLTLHRKNWFGGVLPATAPEPPLAQVPAPAETAAAPPAPAPAETTPAVASAPPASEPPATPAAEAAVTLAIKATDKAWLQVRDSGKVVFSNVIPVGETRTFSTSGTLRVLFGNAGGVEVTYNGKPLPPPGPPGQVRTIEFSKNGFEFIVKQPAPAAPPEPGQLD